jgi:ribosomal protein S1
MLSASQGEFILELNQEEERNSVTFEEFIDQYDYQCPKRGQILEGAIEAINEDSIILDVGLKRAAIVPSREVNNLDDEDFTNLSIGDVIPIEVTQTPTGDQDLIVSINNALEQQSWQNAQNCMNEDQLLDLEVAGSNRGGILVAFDKIEGFVPNSHIPDLREIHNPDRKKQYKQKMRGSTIKVKAIEVDPTRGRLVFSALEVQRAEHLERLKSLKVGDVITGTVVNVVDFGVFVDLGSIDGLVHISELDWQTVKHPSRVAKVGDKMSVQVIGIDLERERVQLSRKALIPNPWDEIEAIYVPGDLVEVEITNVVDFGAFARLPEGVHGLIHQSELGYTSPGYDESIIEPGMKVLTKILRIDSERERIALSMHRVPMEKQLDWMLASYDKNNEAMETET